MESASSSHRRRHRSRSPSDREREERKHRKHRDGSADRDGDDSRHEHKRRNDADEDRGERKKHKKEEKSKRRGKVHRSAGKPGIEVVDEDGEDDWVEKDIDATDAVANIPSGADLFLTSNPSNPPPKSPLPPSTAFDTADSDTRREEWMLDPATRTVPGATRSGNEPRQPPHSATIGGGGGMTEGYGEEDAGGGRLPSGDVDFFSGLGTDRVKKEREPKPDPDKLVIYKNELNTQLLEGKGVDEYAVTEKKAIVAGSAGSQWRMMKLRRVYEQAEEESRTVDEVAMERYGNMDDFNEALEERKTLDDREQRRSERRGGSGGSMKRPGTHRSESGSGYSTPRPGSEAGTPGPSGARRFMFMTDEATASRPSSRNGFRRPGEAAEDTPRGAGAPGAFPRSESTGSLAGVGMMAVHGGAATPPAAPRGTGRFDSKPSTPIPSVLTPQALLRNPLSQEQVATTADSTSSAPPLSTEALNKLQARVLRAKLMEDESAEELEKEYERELERARSSGHGGGDAGDGLWKGGELGVEGQLGRKHENKDGVRTEIQVLPTLDGQGRLYDIGTSTVVEERVLGPGNRKPKPEKFETRDRKTGEVLRYNADDDTTSLGELVRQERFGGGPRDQKDLDMQMANAIVTDGKFENDLDYMDDNADRFGRKKIKSDAAKRAFAVGDFAKTRKALDSCPFCYQDDNPPRAAVVALGNRTYIACTQNEELVEGHCLIVPIQHHLSMLELEDDDWEEVKNHMKCLMQMFAAENKGVLFFETVMSLRHQKHTFIEAVPMPADLFADAPAYFRESIMASESEWSQHKKLIDFSTRPGGFRRAMVPNLPYFMIQWDYKGEKGYGHVIEGMGDAPGKGDNDDDEGNIDEGEKGGGEFPRYFAAEIIGSMLDLEPRKWRKPRRVDYRRNKERASKLGNKFHRYDWTLQLKNAEAGPSK